MPEGNRKTEVNDPETMVRLLEIELAQKRAARQQTNARRRNLRILSFFFLFMVVAGSFFAFYLFFSPEKIDELKSLRSNSTQVSPSPTASPR
jgi:hypothetical protein